MDAFDADILIFLAKEDPRGDRVEPLLSESDPEDPPIGSVILISEVFGQPLERMHDLETERLLGILARLELKDVDRDIAEAAARLRAKYRLRLPDAIHLATAIVWGAARFHTNNSKDFGPHITELEVVLA